MRYGYASTDRMRRWVYTASDDRAAFFTRHRDADVLVVRDDGSLCAGYTTTYFDELVKTMTWDQLCRAREAAAGVVMKPVVSLTVEDVADALGASVFCGFDPANPADKSDLAERLTPHLNERLRVHAIETVNALVIEAYDYGYDDAQSADAEDAAGEDL